MEVTDASVEPAPMMGGLLFLVATGPMSDSEPRAKDESWTERMEKACMRPPLKKFPLEILLPVAAEA